LSAPRRSAAARPERPFRSAIADYEARLAAYEWPDETRRGAPPRTTRRRTAAAYERRRPARPARRRPARSPGRPTRRRIMLRRVVALTLTLVLGWAFISYTTTMLAPSNVGFGVRSVEWLRDHGFAWLVSDVEAVYYSLNAPKKGGPPLRSLPKVGVGGAGASAAAYAPPAIAPAVRPALPGEGVWRRTGALVAGAPPVLVTTFRPDPTYPQLVAGVAWIDRSRTSIQLYPGRYEPPGASARGPMEVPPQARAGLVATFNSGFKLEDSGGGFAALGHVYAPLRDGVATLVGMRDGTVDIRAWTGGPQPGPDVVFARQNLPLIVDGGRLNPNLSDGPEWGATLGNKIRVWRSAIGVDGHGNLLYAAADQQTVASLAQILRRAGAVRAMELDINYEWVSFNTFAAAGARGPLKLLPGMDRPPERYLTPDDRDFFAVFALPAGH
jgi:hypothetical protein